MPARLSCSAQLAPVFAVRARDMRAWPSEEEQRVWQALRSAQLGARFRRQVPVLEARCIADFLAPAVKLVVEVDGPHHRLRRAADRRRDERLRRAGYRVLRVEAEVVRRDVAEAVRRIREALDEAPP